MKKFAVLLAAMIISGCMFAAEQPEFPGGEAALKAYISKTASYPAIAQENGVEGIVVVRFMVMPDGSLQNLKVKKSIDPDLEKEALRVVGGMPAWIPADKDGAPVASPAQVEVPFLLE